MTSCIEVYHVTFCIGVIEVITKLNFIYVHSIKNAIYASWYSNLIYLMHHGEKPNSYFALLIESDLTWTDYVDFNQTLYTHSSPHGIIHIWTLSFGWILLSDVTIGRPIT